MKIANCREAAMFGLAMEIAKAGVNALEGKEWDMRSTQWRDRRNACAANPEPDWLGRDNYRDLTRPF